MGTGDINGEQDTIQENDNGDEAGTLEDGDFAEVDYYPDYEAVGDEDGNYAYDQGGAFNVLDFEEA